MRVSAGKYKGREVLFPKGRLAVRPAMSLMREALFSILGNVEGVLWADIFCGSGIVGIEALSRGAARVDFVDKDKAKRSTLKKNLSWIEEPYSIFFQDAFLFLAKAQEPYDYLYLDPPFSLLEKGQLLKEARETLLRVNSKGMIIIHYPSQEDLVIPESLSSWKSKKYGGSSLEFLELT